MVDVKDVAYEVDGRRMLGRLAVPEGGEIRPAVLILHEGPGLDPFQLGRANRLAEEGYVALAADYHGEGRAFADPAQMMDRLGELSGDPDRAVEIVAAGYDVLLAEPRTDRSRVAVIGYCYGGTLALEFARSGAQLRAVVGFHAGLETSRPEASENIRGSVLICTGADDPFVPFERRRAFEAELTAAGVDWQMHVYGGVRHSFTNPNAAEHGAEGLKYDAVADRRSWQAMLDLYGQVMA